MMRVLVSRDDLPVDIELHPALSALRHRQKQVVGLWRQLQRNFREIQIEIVRRVPSFGVMRLPVFAFITRLTSAIRRGATLSSGRALRTMLSGKMSFAETKPSATLRQCCALGKFLLRRSVEHVAHEVGALGEIDQHRIRHASAFHHGTGCRRSTARQRVRWLPRSGFRSRRRSRQVVMDELAYRDRSRQMKHVRHGGDDAEMLLRCCAEIPCALSVRFSLG